MGEICRGVAACPGFGWLCPQYPNTGLELMYGPGGGGTIIFPVFSISPACPGDEEKTTMIAVTVATL